jgi:hypothetical protein
MRPVILYRGDEFAEEELNPAISAGFFCTNSRMEVPSKSLVIPRYSCLPFYKELENDLAFNGSKLLNSHEQHRYIADMQNWYEDLKDYTPKTWRDVTSVPLTERGPFVVKGETNSKKNLWNTHMFAGDRDFLGRVIGNLLEDSLIKTQSIYIRKWEQFVKLGEGINGLPITREFRFFVAYGEILSSGFYWSSHFEELKERGVSIEAMNPSTVPYPFLEKIISIVGKKANGIVIDIAERTDGQWRVVELNDLQMSGLSENDPDIMYPALFDVIRSRNQRNT